MFGADPCGIRNGRFNMVREVIYDWLPKLQGRDPLLLFFNPDLMTLPRSRLLYFYTKEQAEGKEKGA